MFINKFNQLIRNKWVWGIFAVIVCFLFVASDLFRGDGGAAAQAYGTLGGEAIPYEKYDIARLAVRIDHLLSTGGYAPELAPALLSRRAWRFVAAERTAAKLGLRVSRGELKAQIARLFSDGVNFNQNYYHMFLSERLGCTAGQFEAALATMLAVRKVADAHAQANWLSPSLVEAQSHDQTDRFTLRLASISNEFASAEIEITDEKLQSYYDMSKATYRIPDQVSVRYVAFQASNFADQVPEIDEDDARIRYDDDPSAFAEVVDGVRTNRTFEAALPAIKATLRNEAALKLATEAADTFAEAFYNDRRDADLEAKLLAPDFFESVAEAQGLSVRTTALFSANAPVVGIESVASREFSESAFDLGDDASYRYYSLPIAGKATVYILAYNEFVPAHDPGLEAVRAAVVNAYTEEQRARLFADSVRSKYDAYVAAMEKEGADFEAAATEAGFTIGTNMVLTAFDANRALPGNLRDWLAVLPRVDVGGDSSPVFHDQGAAFAHVLNREDGDGTLRENVGHQLADRQRDSMATTLADDWLEANFAAMDPVVPSEEIDMEEVEE